jgi:hypothetical protein
MRCPVIERAWCEARNTINSATSSGCAIRKGGVACASSAATCFEIQPVSVGGGDSTLAVIPSGASSAPAEARRPAQRWWQETVRQIRWQVAELIAADNGEVRRCTLKRALRHQMFQR